MNRLLSRLLLLGPLCAATAALPACNRQAQNCPPAPMALPAVPAQGAAGPGDTTVVAMIGNEPVTQAELDKSAGRKLYEVREEALDNLITERVVEPAAKAAGMTAEQFIRKQVETKVPEVSEKEAEEFFTKNQDRLGQQFAGKKFADVKDIIVKGLTQQKRQEGVRGVLEDLKSKAGVKVLLQAPRVQVAAIGPAKGPADAKVTIVEFSDFQCPYCARGRKVMEEVMGAYKGKVRLVFRDFPLSFHENAQKAAEAGQCANEQGKFWEMHDWMFDNQKSLDINGLKEGAKKLGLDAVKFEQCLTSSKYANAIAENQKAGQQAGVGGTPAFFVNGVFLNGALPFEKFKTEIDRALAQ